VKEPTYASILVVERQYGYLEMHDAPTLSGCGQRRPTALGVTAAAATARRCSLAVFKGSTPSAFWSTGTSSAQWYSGESLFVFELQPASYASRRQRTEGRADQTSTTA
jgi:hypothetical protein